MDVLTHTAVGVLGASALLIAQVGGWVLVGLLPVWWEVALVEAPFTALLVLLEIVAPGYCGVWARRAPA